MKSNGGVCFCLNSGTDRSSHTYKVIPPAGFAVSSAGGTFGYRRQDFSGEVPCLGGGRKGITAAVVTHAVTRWAGSCSDGGELSLRGWQCLWVSCSGGGGDFFPRGLRSLGGFCSGSGDFFPCGREFAQWLLQRRQWQL